MRTIQSSDAKARFAELLDGVERGESFVITRRGKAVARVIPEDCDRREKTLRAMKAIEALRKRMPRMTIEEILSARHEGHKY